MFQSYICNSLRSLGICTSSRYSYSQRNTLTEEGAQQKAEPELHNSLLCGIKRNQIKRAIFPNDECWCCCFIALSICLSLQIPYSFMRYPPLTHQMQLAGREAIYSDLFQKLATNFRRPLVFSCTLVYFYNGFGVEVVSLTHNILWYWCIFDVYGVRICTHASWCWLVDSFVKNHIFWFHFHLWS